MPFSYLTHLACSRCGARHEANVVQSTCACGAPLLARYDLESLGRACNPGTFAEREPTLWRYHELLPVGIDAARVSLGEGMTPIITLSRTGQAIGLDRLSVKDEGQLPTGSFKARGAAVGVSRARELGVRRVAMPTNGNAGAAWAAYCARAGLESLIVMPRDAPLSARVECAAAGARVLLVDGLIGDAGALSAQAVRDHGYMDAATLREPYRLEGKKTMGLELFEQLGWRVPDVIVYPTGGGVGLIGIDKAWQECQALGWLHDQPPRFVAVQAAGCAPIVRAWQEGALESVVWPDASTVAFGITVPKALGDFLVLDALYRTEGCAIAVDDAAILAAQARVAALDGIFMCPEGAACVAAVEDLRRSGWLMADAEVVVINTGTGILYPETVAVSAPVLHPGDELPA
ncbi:MAG: threonine synthase [Candidatus Dormiibacterota bacterium]